MRLSIYPPINHLLSLILTFSLIPIVLSDWQYKSRPDLSPPKLNITTLSSSRVSSKYIFVAPYTIFPFHQTESYAPIQPAPYIFSSTGELVWSGLGYFSGLPQNFQAGRYDGEDILFGFEGNWAGRPGNTHGHVKILNQRYETIKEIRSGSHRVLDSHEFNILDEKTALIQSNHPIPYDLTTYGMKADSQWVMVATFQEIDLKSGKLLFEWNSIDHVDLTESNDPVSSCRLGTGHNSSDPVDYFHLNSVERLPDSNYLISARHTSTIYKINSTTGAVIWRLGGNKSDFKLEEGVGFDFQHDARLISSSKNLTIISIFDNSDADGIPSGKLISIDTETWKAKLLQRFSAPDSISSYSQGNTQVLDDRNVFVNWGSAGAISEFLPNGTIVFHAYLDSGEHFEKGDVENYRGFKFDWNGIPTESPAVVALRHGESTMIYVSWNGDTETKIWKFYGHDGEQEILLGEEPRTGFETGFYVTEGDKWETFRARAFDKDGKILTSSGVVGAQPYIYQYVPGRDDLIWSSNMQQILGSRFESGGQSVFEDHQ